MLAARFNEEESELNAGLFISPMFSEKEKNMANEQRAGSGNFANDRDVPRKLQKDAEGGHTA